MILVLELTMLVLHLTLMIPACLPLPLGQNFNFKHLKMALHFGYQGLGLLSLL
jgi:hypothetical protein